MLSLYLVRTIDPNSGTENWVKVQASDFDDARRQVERMGLSAREVMLDASGRGGSEQAASDGGASDGGASGAGEAEVEDVGAARAGDGTGRPRWRAAEYGPSWSGRGDEAARVSAGRVQIVPNCLLISAIFNFISAGGLVLVGLFLCFPLLLAAPFVVLGVYELKYRGRLRAGDLSPGTVSAVRTIAVLEIVTVIGGNVASMVCGIVTLANQQELGVPAVRLG